LPAQGPRRADPRLAGRRTRGGDPGAHRRVQQADPTGDRRRFAVRADGGGNRVRTSTPQGVGPTRTATRLPDCVVIGAMKCGTTSLHRWLRAQPDVFVPQQKELDFFSHDEWWMRGPSWYGAVFGQALPDQVGVDARGMY